MLEGVVLELQGLYHHAPHVSREQEGRVDEAVHVAVNPEDVRLPVVTGRVRVVAEVVVGEGCPRERITWGLHVQWLPPDFGFTLKEGRCHVAGGKHP